MEFVSLVATSDQFTPAGNNDFRYGDALIAYFKLCEPTMGRSSKHCL
jgi:hypothetical protein